MTKSERAREMVKALLEGGWPALEAFAGHRVENREEIETMLRAIFPSKA